MKETSRNEDPAERIATDFIYWNFAEPDLEYPGKYSHDAVGRLARVSDEQLTHHILLTEFLEQTVKLLNDFNSIHETCFEKRELILV